MSRTLNRRQLLQATVAVGLSAALPAVRACEFFSTTLRVTHPWTRATAGGANTAILNMKFDEVLEDDRLIAVESPVAAGAEMGGTVKGTAVRFDIPAGKETLLSEDSVFVRLTGLKHPLELGRSYPLILVFERGGRIHTDLSIDQV